MMGRHAKVNFRTRRREEGEREYREIPRGNCGIRLTLNDPWGEIARMSLCIPLPSFMHAAVYRGQGDVRVERVPLPALRAGEALVRIEACGVCTTDLKKVEYGLVPPPRIFGHEMAGVIVKLGRGVKGWRVGDRVAVGHHVPCERCFYCERKDYAQCAVYRKTGTTAGFEPAGGGFAQYIRVMPWILKRGTLRIPRGVSFEEASFIEPVNTCLKGVDRLQLRKNDIVLIFGQGPIGLIFTQILRTRHHQVFGLDLMASRRRLARRLGAHCAADPRAIAFERRLRRLTHGRGADAAIMTVPSESAFHLGFRSIRPGGKILLFAHTKKGDSLSVDAGTVCVDEKTILGSYSASIDLQAEAARLVFSRKVRVTPLITHHFSLDDIDQAFRLATHPTSRSLKIIVNPQKKAR